MSLFNHFGNNWWRRWSTLRNEQHMAVGVQREASIMEDVVSEFAHGVGSKRGWYGPHHIISWPEGFAQLLKESSKAVLDYDQRLDELAKITDEDIDNCLACLPNR